MGNRELTTLVETWFAENSDHGEFVYNTRAVPYSVIGPTSAVERIIFTTKPAIVATAIDKGGVPEQFGMIGRYGLPNEDDLLWICKVMGPRALLFLGDMDPVDLMIFAWLRACLHPKHITYLGVNDIFLRALDLSSDKSLSCPCARSERKSVALLRKVFPDFPELVGTKCARTLKEGCKIELDAIVSAKGTATAVLQPAITSDN